MKSRKACLLPLGVLALTLGSACILQGTKGPSTKPEPVVVTRPSELFFDGRQNAKDPGSIVARDVEVAGWLVGQPIWNCEDGRSSCEDIHYEVELDPDWIEARYAGTPLATALLPGYTGARPPVEHKLPFADFAPNGKSRGITTNSFLLPGAFASRYNAVSWEGCDNLPPDQKKVCLANLSSVTLHVELNAWNQRSEGRWVGRGTPPAGWVHKADYFPNSWFPYDPNNPDGTGDLKSGDYVILKGTLFLDVEHLGQGPLISACRIFGGLFCEIQEPVVLPSPLHTIPGNLDLEQQSCWDRGDIPPEPRLGWTSTRTMHGYGSWLEMHPPDSIRKATPPKLRKATGGLVLCAPVFLVGTIDTSRNATFVIQAPPRPDATSVLKYRELVDGRYTDWLTVERHELSIVGDELHGAVTVRSSDAEDPLGRREGRFKAVYSVWWEPPGSGCAQAHQLNAQIANATRTVQTLLQENAKLDPDKDKDRIVELHYQLASTLTQRADLWQRATSLGCPQELPLSK